MVVGGEWDYSEKKVRSRRECVTLDAVVMHVGVHQALTAPHVKAVVCAATKVPELPTSERHSSLEILTSLWEISEVLVFLHCGPPAPND